MVPLPSSSLYAGGSKWSEPDKSSDRRRSFYLSGWGGKEETTQLPLEAPVQKYFIVSFGQMFNVKERESFWVHTIYKIKYVPQSF